MEQAPLHDAPPRQDRVDDHPLVVRRYTDGVTHPFDQVVWVTRDAWPEDSLWHMKGVESPDFWSQQAVDITAKLYLNRSDTNGETSVRQLIARVVEKISFEGLKAGYFGKIGFTTYEGTMRKFHKNSHGDEVRGQFDIFRDELAYVCLHQTATFNSPVWFNIGRDDRPQCPSACFLLGVEDTTEDIMRWARDEAFIFKSGSGSSANISRLRGAGEPMSTGGTSSGPVSFMRLPNAVAETVKSGGTTRRAARMVQMDADHPDIEDFIACKPREERRLRVLAEAGVGLGMGPEGERNMAELTSYQSANNSVRVTDDFMTKATHYRASAWHLVPRKGGRAKIVAADELLDKMAQAAWECADPGLIFHDTVNAWHTTPADGPIRVSNACLPGETLVDTSEGRVRIDHLAEMYASGIPLPLAFAFDQDEARPGLRRIRRAFVTKMASQLVEVKTDKGVTFRCTPDHLVLTRRGGRSSEHEYVEAGNLLPGMRLRKIARWVNHERSGRRYINERVLPGKTNGTTCQSIWMWEQAYGPVPFGMDVHHINEDSTDDRLSNFELVDSSTHKSFHSTGTKNNNCKPTDDSSIVELYELAETFLVKSSRVGRQAWRKAISISGLEEMVSKGNSRGIWGMTWDELQAYVDERRSLVNDVVVSIHIIDLDGAIPVYDLEVDGTHNFAVASDGAEHTIIVHNCSEVHTPDNSSCNLAALNAVLFLDEDGNLKVDDVRHVVDVMTLAMDILVEFCELPTELLTERTRRYRWLGLGASNIGAAIMCKGMAYDSSDGRDFASSLMALITGRCYRTSARIASRMGPFEGWEPNADAMMGVIDRHREHLKAHESTSPTWLVATHDWSIAREQGVRFGFRNAQATVIAPNGTTSFFMDCDTTGIEPAFSLVQYKTLAGGGSMTLVNGCVRRALVALGYTDDDVGDAVEALRLGGVGAFLPLVRSEHVDVFAGANDIPSDGHIRMLATVQPFLSGAASKTINLPFDATLADIRRCFVQAWELGVKCIAVYRDGSKARQVLSTSDMTKEDSSKQIIADAVRILDDPQFIADDINLPRPVRRRLPRTRSSRTHKIHVRSAMGEHEGYVSAGMYEDGALGEMFLEGFGRSGGFVSNALAAWATAFSIAVQYGTPWDVIARKHVGHSDETGGMVVPDPSGAQLVIRSCDSIVDYIARWLISEFGDADLQDEAGVMTDAVKARRMVDHAPAVVLTDDVSVVMDEAARWVGPPPNGNGHGRSVEFSAHPCPECAAPLRRTGSCMACGSCGYTSGCG